jgi:hypothetical protein
MTMTRGRVWLRVLLLLTAFACVASWATSQVRSIRDRSEVAQLTEKRKAVCVGRHLVDVPVRAHVTLSRQRVAGFEIETVEEDEASFRSRVAAREAEIAERGSASGGVGAMVEARDLRIPSMVGRTMPYGRNRGYLMDGDRRIEDEFVSVEVHAHMNSRSFKLSAQYADEARATLAEALLGRLRLRGADETPSEPGFCIEHAYFQAPLPVNKAEHIAMHLTFPDHHDLSMTFSSMPGGGAEPDLLARVAETDATLGMDERLRVTKLRLGKRSFNGLDGEEVLEKCAS